MKKILGIFFLIFTMNVHGQSLIDSLKNPRFSLEDSIGKKLADMVLQSPDLKVIDKQIEASKFEWKSNKASWLNNLNANFNLNERNLTGNNDPESNVFYPRYNFSLNLPLGNFITKSAQARKARAQYDETVYKKEVATREIRQAILSAYQNYMMYKYLLGVQELVIQDESKSFAQIEDKFKNNTVTMDVFTSASKRYNEALGQRVTLMRNMNVSKYELEALIGMKLEDALLAIAVKK